MAYDKTTGIITAPVNTDDISAAIGLNSHDIGTLWLSDKVNPDSLCKPLRNNSPASTPWTGYNSPGDFGNVRVEADKIVTCGYYIPKCAATKDNITNILANSKWDREPLAGYACFDHFINYSAKASFSEYPWPIKTVQLEEKKNIMVWLQVSAPATQLCMTSVPFFRGMWPGVALFTQGPAENNGKQVWSLVDIRTQTEVSGGMRLDQIIFSGIDPSIGMTYLMVPFVSDQKIEGTAQLSASKTLYCATLKAPMSCNGRIGPYGGVQTARFASEMVWIESDLQWNGNRKIAAAFKFHNESGKLISGITGTFTIREYKMDGTVLRTSTKAMTNMTSAQVADGAYMYYNFDYDVVNHVDTETPATEPVLRSVSFSFNGSFSPAGSPAVAFSAPEAQLYYYRVVTPDPGT